MQTCTHAIVTGSILFVAAAAMAGGPLAPPSGPPTETPGPEPRIAINDLPGDVTAQHIIDAPGSYYLADNILGEGGGKHAVLITTPGPVVIDGMGFTMEGVVGSGDAFHIFDDTNEPMRWEIRNAYPIKWTGAVCRSSGSADTASNEHNFGAVLGLNWNHTNTSSHAIVHEGNIMVRGCVGLGGGIFNDNGTLTITDSTIVGNEAVAGTALPAIDADGLTMRNVEVRLGEGVKARKPREIVVVGSKVKEVVRGVALELAEGAVVEDTQADGVVDASDFTVWRNNTVRMDFNDPDVVASTFGAGSQISEGVFIMLGPLSAGEHAIEISEEVSFFYNKIVFLGTGAPTALALFSTGRSSIVGNLVQGVPAGAAGFEVNGILNVVRDNEFYGSGMSSIGVSGTAARSVFRGNTMMDIGTSFALFGAGLNYLGPDVTPLDVTYNTNPDRNLRIPPIDPVR